MIRDAKGRKWSMRFKQYRNGWHWEAKHNKNGGFEAGQMFKTKAAAEADARSSIQDRDPIAMWGEYFSRLRKRGTECQLTITDYEAIERAGRGE